MGYHFLLQGIFPTQGLNPGLLHCRQMRYRLSHQGSQTEAQGLFIQCNPDCSSCRGFPGWLSSKESACMQETQETWVQSLS